MRSKGRSKKLKFAYSAAKAEKIIPDVALKYFPFSAASLSEWTEENDLLQFLYALHDKSGFMTRPDGKSTSVNYRSYGATVYKRGKRHFDVWAQRFTKGAREATPAPGASTQTIEFPDFQADPDFGRMAKYSVAWNGVVGEVLAESAFFSIAHLLEARDDLECSLLLAAELYYKQAVQNLRNYLEDLVLPVHFCDNRDNYLAWKKNSYRVPPLRGTRGVLKRLVERGLVPNSLSERVSDLYGRLNGFVHASEKHLIHKGHFTGQWMGYVFKKEDFSEWCKSFCDSVEIGVELLKINIEQYRALSAEGRILCDICHNKDDFEVEIYEFGGEEHSRIHCRSCGNTMHLSGNVHSKSGKVS